MFADGLMVYRQRWGGRSAQERPQGAIKTGVAKPSTSQQSRRFSKKPGNGIAAVASAAS
jgi:hypothetical protein